jgi:hypothetical protein
MTTWLAAGLLFLGWHFTTTFFVPAGAPHDRGWVVWPFGRDSRPPLGQLPGVLTPNRVPAEPAPTLALVLAAIASLGFLAALAGLFGVILPAGWWPAVVIAASLASGGLFLLYLGPWALLPLLIDGVLLWGLIARGWSVAGLAAA